MMLMMMGGNNGDMTLPILMITMMGKDNDNKMLMPMMLMMMGGNNGDMTLPMKMMLMMMVMMMNGGNNQDMLIPMMLLMNNNKKDESRTGSVDLMRPHALLDAALRPTGSAALR